MKKRRVSKCPVKRRKGFPAWALLALVISALILGLLGTWMREKRHTAEGASQRSMSHHGGTVRVVDQRKYELVLTPDMVALYVLDDAKQITSKGGQVSLMYSAGSESANVDLEPAGRNKFQAPRPASLPKGAKVIALIKIPGELPRQLAFDPD